MASKQRAWLVMLVAYLAGIAIALNLSKVPPVMPVLIQTLGLDLALGGWLMSSFAVAGVVLGIPAALLLGRLGAKGAGLLALGSTLLGSVIGALAAGPGLLLLSRAVEGIGMGLIAVVAPAVISLWFPPEARGTPMGVWASWVPVGGFLIYNLAGPLLKAFGWQGLWWFGALCVLAALVLYAAVVGAPPPAEAAKSPAPEAGGRFGRLFLNPSSWILALVFATFTFAFTAYSTWAPTYLNQELGIDLETANFDASLTSLAIIPSTIVAGWILDRTKRRGLVLAAALLASGLLLSWSFRLGDPGVVAPFFVALGCVAGFIPTTAFTLAPETMPRPELAGLALGILSVGQNLGLFFGPPAIAAVIADGNWGAGVIPLVASLAVGVIAVWLLPARRAGSG